MPDEVIPELAELWLQMRPVALERCAVVLRSADTDDVGAHAEARGEAHKLAGSLGMYGLAAASETAAGRAEVAALARSLRESLEPTSP